MSLSRIGLLAVDLDGTLIDSAPDLAHCVGLALESVGFDAPGERRTRSWIGDGVETLIARALAHAGVDENDAETFAAAFATFTECYRRSLYVRSTLYPDVAETLATLSDRGVRLCCVTNKRHALADEILRQAGIRDRFEFVIGGDSLPHKKPSPVPLESAARRCGVSAADAAMVGDSYHDFHAARDAGFAFFWAAYGYCAQIDAEPADAVTVIHGFAALLRAC